MVVSTAAFSSMTFIKIEYGLVFMSVLSKRLSIVSIGMAMFSMFFGAGNIVFPLMIGQITQDKSLAALLGLVITAVGVPFAGLFAMTLFDGDYRAFFNRLGKIPSFLIVVIIMGLIGPFGATPRCITLSYATTKMFFPEIGIIAFSIVSCIVIYLLTIRKSRITDILGIILTPFLLVSLAFIVVMGILNRPQAVTEAEHTHLSAFVLGLVSGYQTMDLLGAFFFCAVVIDSLKSVSAGEGSPKKALLHNAFLASVVGAFLLAVVYVGMSIVAALHSVTLADISADILLGTISLNVLGPYAGIITCFAVILACITTALALVVVFAEFIHYDILQGKISYQWSLITTLAITAFFSTLKFHGLLAILAPIVEVIYPSLLVLSIVNIAYKLWGFPYVKIPVGITFAGSLIYTLIS